MSSPAWDSPEFRVKSDTPWCAQYRWLQSWYRETVLKVPAGRDSYNVRGNLICETALAERPDLNFLSKEIFQYAGTRADEVLAAGGTLEKNRLFRNMLSSMPLCFNLFGQLRQMPSETAKLLGGLLDLDIATIESVDVEYAPPAYLHLQDKTAFDAFISYRDSKTRSGFIAVETKYTEPFSREMYLSDLYVATSKNAKSGFAPNSWNELKKTNTNQLWRNALLALSLQWTGYEHATVLVLSCAEDKTAKQAVEGVRKYRGGGDKLIRHVSFEKLMEHAGGISALAGWSTAFTQRYLNLQPVQAANVLRRK